MEEAAVLLNNVTPDHAMMLAEQARLMVQSEASSKASTVTVSVGIASLALSAKTSDELMYHADAAMYSAKADGKNRVVNWDKTHRLEPAA